MHNPMFDPNEPQRVIMARSRKHDSGYQQKAKRALARIVDDNDLSAFTTLTGRCDGAIHALLSNGLARQIIREALVREVIAFSRQHPMLDIRLVTLFHSPWRSGLFDTVIHIGDLVSRSRKVIDSCGVEGALLLAEIQAAQDPTDRSLWSFPHQHGLVVTQSGFKPRVTAQRINAGGRLVQFNGADCLQISDRLASEADIARVCSYIIKEPFSGKDFNPRTGRPERSIRLMTDERCLRMTELLSAITFFDALMSTGCMRSIRSRLLARLGSRHDIDQATAAAADKATEFWAQLRATGRLKGTGVVLNRGPLKSRKMRSAGAMPVERCTSWQTPRAEKHPRSMSHINNPSTGLFDPATLLIEQFPRKDSLGRFPDFKVAFTGRDSGPLRDAYDRMLPTRRQNGLPRPYNLMVYDRVRAAKRAMTQTAYTDLSSMDGANPITRLKLTHSIIAAARRAARADPAIDVRVGELRHVGWQVPMIGGVISLAAIRRDASVALRRLGFVGALSSINLRLAQTAAEICVIVAAVRFVAWGSNDEQIRAGYEAIADDRLLLTPDRDPERGLMSWPIQEEETMFRALGFALDQRFGSFDHVGGFIVPQDRWGEGPGRAYIAQTDMEMRYATADQLAKLRSIFVGIPLADVVWGNGSGRTLADHAVDATAEYMHRLRAIGRF